MLPLVVLFILWPIVELALLIRIGQSAGVGATLLLILLPALVGAGLAKREGLKTYSRIQRELGEGRLPGDPLIDALLILIAGALLITPGLISDVIGLLLLVPLFRRLIRERLKRRFRNRFTVMHFGPPGAAGEGDDDFVDVDARPVDEENAEEEP
ncbi:MAG: FxsA family protein [Planctomycetes bacterium]|nr:FxsA family protein [Planctomycetota bacterium]